MDTAQANKSETVHNTNRDRIHIRRSQILIISTVQEYQNTQINQESSDLLGRMTYI